MDWRRAKRPRNGLEQAFETAKDRRLREGHVRPAGPARQLSRAEIARIYGADKLSTKTERVTEGRATQR